MLLPGLGTLRSCARPIPSGHREDLRKCKHGCTVNCQVLRRISGSASLISLHASRYFAAALSESQPTSHLYASLAFSRADCSADIHGVLTLVIVWWVQRANLPGVAETPLPSFFLIASCFVGRPFASSSVVDHSPSSCTSITDKGDRYHRYFGRATRRVLFFRVEEKKVRV